MDKVQARLSEVRTDSLMLHLISYAFKRRYVQPVRIKVYNQQVNTITFILRSL